MRLASVALCLGGTSALAATVQSINAPEGERVVPDRWIAMYDTEPTYFEGMRVPALPQLTNEGDVKADFNRTKYVVVNFGSPYCPHCLVYKPTYQTLYEYYYTTHMSVNPDESSPAPATTFREYYELEFSTVNCVVDYDLCAKYDIKSYPMTTLFKNGEIFRTVRGAQKMNVVADMIENVLESEYPGTRPLHPLLPAPGASSRPVPENVPQVKTPTDESQKPLNLGESNI